MMDAIASTARWTAAARARESARPDRLFDDPLAQYLAGEEGFALLDAETQATKENPYLPLRTRFFDDWLQRVTTQTGIHQIVLVAAGLDTRAYRLPWPEGTRFWELDQPALLDEKQRILDAVGASPACDRRTLGVDLARDDWSERLGDAGFDAAAPSVWLAEGFVQYLEADGVAHILDAVARLAAPGSHLGVDMVASDFLTSEWMVEYLRSLELRGSPWRFGTNEPEELLARHGWRVEAVTQPGEEGAHFGRWPWPVAPRSIPSLPRSWLITAIRGNS